MEFDIKKHGDYLEHSFSDFIKSRLPIYENIWKCYIGNDGNGKMPEVNGLNNDVAKNRVKFAQLNYSCLESIIFINRIVTKNENGLPIQAFEDYLNAQDDFLLFQVHLGRIRDLMEKIGILLGIKGLELELYDYYQKRNTVIHGKKLPFILICGILGIPEPQGNDSDSVKWTSDKNWADVEVDDFKILPDFYKDTFDELLSIMIGIYSKVFEVIKEVVERNKIRITPTQEFYNYSTSPFDNLKLTSQQTNISGSTYTSL